MGSHVSPSECSMPISAACRIWDGVPAKKKGGVTISAHRKGSHKGSRTSEASSEPGCSHRRSDSNFGHTPFSQDPLSASAS